MSDSALPAQLDHLVAWHPRRLLVGHLCHDHSRLRWVREDGTLGNAVNLDPPEELRDWLRRTRPLSQEFSP